MIYVHVPDGASEAFVHTLNSGTLAVSIQGFFVEGPGRASAALLSVVSGYLAATTLLKGGSVYSLYRRRFESIILPMVFWGLLTVLVYWLVSRFRPTFLDDAVSWLDRLNIVFFLTEMPQGATLHLGFLRDLFVCVLLSPILLPAIRRMAGLILPLLGLFYLFEHDHSSIVILRPLVLFAFCIGIFLASRRAELDRLDRYWPLFVLLAVAATLAILLVNSGMATGIVSTFAARGMAFDETVLYPLGRLFGSLAIWTLIPLMLGARLRAWVIRFNPYLFAAFCSHFLILTILFHAAWQPLFGDRNSGLFLVWFLLAPFTAMAVALMIVKLTQRIAPPLAKLLTGGRVSGSRPVSAIQERQRQALALGWWLLAGRMFERLSASTGALLRNRRQGVPLPSDRRGSRAGTTSANGANRATREAGGPS